MGRYDGGYDRRYGGGYGGGGGGSHESACRVGKRTLTDGLIQRVQAKKKDEDQSNDSQEVQADKVASAHLVATPSREEHFMKCEELHFSQEEAMAWPTGKQPVAMLERLFQRIKAVEEKKSHRKSRHDADAESVLRQTSRILKGTLVEMIKWSLPDLMDTKHIVEEANDPRIKDDLKIFYADAPYTTTATDEVSIICVGNGAFQESLKFLVLCVERELYRLTKQHAQNRVCKAGYSAGYGDFKSHMKAEEMIDLEINALSHSQWQAKNIDAPDAVSWADAKIAAWKKLRSIPTLTADKIMKLRDLPDEEFIKEADKIAEVK